MTWLLDGNVLVALSLPNHTHFERVHRWLSSQRRDFFATCAVTEGTLLRIHMQLAADPSAHAAWEQLANIRKHPRHQFFDDGFSYTEIPPSMILGHRQITDAWLVHLAKKHDCKLATLDIALSALWPASVVLIPV